MENRTDLLVRVAELYYEQGLNQNEIAKLLSISRPTVSRLLDEAKDAGVVEIIVHSPIRKDPTLSYALRNTFRLREAIVINGAYDYPKALRRCCEAASHFFNTIMDNNKSVGIAWGSVPQLLCELIEEHPYYNVNVVQMVGCLGTGNPNVDGIELALRISKRLGGTYSNIYAPIYVGSEAVYSYLVSEPQIEATLRKAAGVDIILTGIGSFNPETTLQRAGYWTDKDRMDFISKGAVGHMMARPYDKDGNEVTMEGRYTIGAPLSAMRNADWSIGIAAGAFRADAVLGGVRGGYLNALVTDQALAQELLRLSGAQRSFPQLQEQ